MARIWRRAHSVARAARPHIRSAYGVHRADHGRAERRSTERDPRSPRIPFRARRRTVGPGIHRPVHAMTDKEHESQRNLVALSLRICPEGGRHKGKGHEAKLAEHTER